MLSGQLLNFFELYQDFTKGNRTNWSGMTREYNLRAMQHTQKGGMDLWPKVMHHLQRFEKKMVKAVVTRDVELVHEIRKQASAAAAAVASAAATPSVAATADPQVNVASFLMEASRRAAAAGKENSQGVSQGVKRPAAGPPVGRPDGKRQGGLGGRHCCTRGQCSWTIESEGGRAAVKAAGGIGGIGLHEHRATCSIFLASQK